MWYVSYVGLCMVCSVVCVVCLFVSFFFLHAHCNVCIGACVLCVVYYGGVALVCVGVCGMVSCAHRTLWCMSCALNCVVYVFGFVVLWCRIVVVLL